MLLVDETLFYVKHNYVPRSSNLFSFLDQFKSNWQHAILQQTDEYRELRKQCLYLMDELKVGQEAREWIDKELLNYETEDHFDQCDDLTRRQVKALNENLKPFLAKFKKVKIAKKDELNQNSFFEDLVYYAHSKSIHLPQDFVESLMSLPKDHIIKVTEAVVQCESMTYKDRISWSFCLQIKVQLK